MQPEPVPMSRMRRTRPASIHGSNPACDQFGERRARHDDPRVDLELEARKPHAAHEVGGRHAPAHALCEQLQHPLTPRGSGARS